MEKFKAAGAAAVMTSKAKHEAARTRESARNIHQAQVDTHETRRRQWLRLLTVVAYVFSVSMAAIVLGLYYTFFWTYVPPAAAGSRLVSSGGGTQQPLPTPLPTSSPAWTTTGVP